MILKGADSGLRKNFALVIDLLKTHCTVHHVERTQPGGARNTTPQQPGVGGVPAENQGGMVNGGQRSTVSPHGWVLTEDVVEGARAWARVLCRRVPGVREWVGEGVLAQGMAAVVLWMTVAVVVACAGWLVHMVARCGGMCIWWVGVSMGVSMAVIVVLVGCVFLPHCLCLSLVFTHFCFAVVFPLSLSLSHTHTQTHSNTQTQTHTGWLPSLCHYILSPLHVPPNPWAVLTSAALLTIAQHACVFLIHVVNAIAGVDEGGGAAQEVGEINNCTYEYKQQYLWVDENTTHDSLHTHSHHPLPPPMLTPYTGTPIYPRYHHHQQHHHQHT